MTNFLSSTRVATVTTRMGPDLRNVIERTPGIGGLSLWVKFMDVDTDDIAYTDGKHVCAGTKYHDYTDAPDREWVIQHELLHVALGHPSRGRTLANRHADFEHDLFNIATDAIINAALNATLHRHIPEGGINLEAVLRGINRWPDGESIATAVPKWSSEQLYAALKEDKAKTGKSNAELACGLRAGEGEAKGKKPYNGDLKAGAVAGETQEQRDGEAREWAHRLKQAAGITPGLMERLVGELPTVSTPWERRLRDYLHRHASRKRIIDFARPTRRWSAIEEPMRLQEGVDLPFQPSSRPGPSANIAVAVDTSGSIDNDLLRRFSGEIAAIIRRTDCRVRLIVCDAAVHQIEDLSGFRGQQRLRSFVYKGGGGTDFKPAIEAAAAFKPDAMVFLTDLCGDAGRPPSFPVLWAVPIQFKDVATPYGQRIDLD